MYRKIIVAIALGGIEKGEKILRKAASLLDDGGEIIALNVIEDVPSYVAIELPANMVEDVMKDSREQLQALLAAAGVAATVEIGNGPPAKAIISAAESHGADLIIVASHVPDFSNYFIGATADRVCAMPNARCWLTVRRFDFSPCCLSRRFTARALCHSCTPVRSMRRLQSGMKRIGVHGRVQRHSLGL